MRLFLSAGEASGDAVAAKLLGLIRAKAPDLPLEVEAVGSRSLQAAGAKLVADSSGWGAIGILSIFRVAARAFISYGRAVRSLKRGQPGLLIAADAGFVNVPLARTAKKAGWRVLYLNPPGSWKRDSQGKDLPEVADIIVTPFSWSADILKSMGANVHWFGHPTLEMVNYDLVEPERLDTLAILPGSRHAEINQLMPVLAEAFADLPQICEFAVAPTMGEAKLREIWARYAPHRKQDIFTFGDAYGVLRRCRAAVVCSGTATLEAALCRCPFVVIYKIDGLSVIESHLLRRSLTYVSQPNILLQRAVVRELLQEIAEPKYLRKAVDELLTDESVREAQLQQFQELRAVLGESNALTRTAELAIAELRKLA